MEIYIYRFAKFYTLKWTLRVLETDIYSNTKFEQKIKVRIRVSLYDNKSISSPFPLKLKRLTRPTRLSRVVLKRTSSRWIRVKSIRKLSKRVNARLITINCCNKNFTACRKSFFHIDSTFDRREEVRKVCLADFNFAKGRGVFAKLALFRRVGRGRWKLGSSSSSRDAETAGAVD